MAELRIVLGRNKNDDDNHNHNNNNNKEKVTLLYDLAQRKDDVRRSEGNALHHGFRLAARRVVLCGLQITRIYYYYYYYYVKYRPT